jgi:hypothetical protein
MAWPTFSNGVTLSQWSGANTQWGTDGISTNSHIVISIRPRDLTELVYTENGSGIRIARVILLQGRQYDVTVLAYANMASLNIGSTVTCIDPISNASANFTVTEQDFNAQRREFGTRTFTGEYLTMIEGNGVIPAGQSGVVF